jgi:alkanesulfonate monooxygenase SsuD/methylene tetrahydromethanopterin reductase-like flavin-dependent oxidoreductase (luciferase family)
MLPDQQMVARMLTGVPLGPVPLVEEAAAAQLTEQQHHIVQDRMQRAVVGTPTEAADQLRALAERFDVDEVMVIPVASAHAGTDPATAPGRVTTLELLAKELL